MRKYSKASTTVVDVRTPAEFVGGHNEGSINIPLQEIETRISELEKINGDILLCCASGGRSGLATTILQTKGFKNVENAGPWTNVRNFF